MYFDEIFVEYRICYRFNGYQNSSIELLTTDKKHITFGFMLTFLMPDPLSRIRVFVADNYLNYLDYSTSFTLDPNVFVDIMFSRKIEKKLKNPYNPCQQMGNKTYRQQNCIFSCMLERVDERSNCTFPGLYRKKDKAICGFRSTWSQVTQYHPDCAKQCPRECEITTYVSTVVSKVLNEHYGYSEHERIVAIRSFYQALSYIELSQIPKTTISDYFSIIGGKQTFSYI